MGSPRDGQYSACSHWPHSNLRPTDAWRCPERVAHAQRQPTPASAVVDRLFQHVSDSRSILFYARSFKNVTI